MIIDFLYSHGKQLVDLFTLALGSLAVWVAYRGLNTWRKQLKLGLDLDISKDLLRRANQARTSLEYVALPYFIGEERRRFTVNQLLKDVNIQLQKDRYFKARELQVELENSLREALIIWSESEKSADLIEPIDSISRMVFDEIERIEKLENALESAAFEPTLAPWSFPGKDYSGDKDLSREINSAFLPLEEFIGKRFSEEKE